MSAQQKFEELPPFLLEAFRLAFVTNAKQLADFSKDEIEKDVLRSVKFWIQMIANGTEPVEPCIKSEASRVVKAFSYFFGLKFELPLALRKLIKNVHLLACEEKKEHVKSLSWDDFKSRGIIDELKCQNAILVSFREDVMDCFKEVNANIEQVQSSVSSLSSFVTDEPVPKSQKSVSSPNETEKKDMPKFGKMTSEDKFRNLPLYILEAFRLIFILNAAQLADYSKDEFENDLLIRVTLLIQNMANGTTAVSQSIKSEALNFVDEVKQLSLLSFALPLPLKKLLNDIHTLACEEKIEMEELRDYYLKHWVSNVENRLRKNYAAHEDLLTKELKIIKRAGRMKMNCFTCADENEFVVDIKEEFEKCPLLNVFNPTNYYRHAAICIEHAIQEKLKEKAEREARGENNPNE